MQLTMKDLKALKGLYYPYPHEKRLRMDALDKATYIWHLNGSGVTTATVTNNVAAEPLKYGDYL